jgi:chromosome partitioning protein
MSTKVNQAAILKQPLLGIYKNAKVRKAFQDLAKEIINRVE